MNLSAILVKQTETEQKNCKLIVWSCKNVDLTNFRTVKRLKPVVIFRWCYWPKMNLSVALLRQMHRLKKLQFRTILFPYKKCVTKKKTYVNKGCNLLNPYFLTVLLSIPCNKSPCEVCGIERWWLGEILSILCCLSLHT